MTEHDRNLHVDKEHVIFSFEVFSDYVVLEQNASNKSPYYVPKDYEGRTVEMNQP